MVVVESLLYRRRTSGCAAKKSICGALYRVQEDRILRIGDNHIITCAVNVVVSGPQLLKVNPSVILVLGMIAASQCVVELIFGRPERDEEGRNIERKSLAKGHFEAMILPWIQGLPRVASDVWDGALRAWLVLVPCFNRIG